MSLGNLVPFNPVEDDFKCWVGLLDNYLLAHDIDKSDDKDGGAKKAVAVFLSLLNTQTYTILRELISPHTPDSINLDALLKELMDHFNNAPNALVERHKFFSRRQEVGESVQKFLAELRKAAVTCKFTHLETSLRDQFIAGLLSNKTRNRIFLEPDDVTLAKVVFIAVSMEAVEDCDLSARNSPSASEPTCLNSILEVCEEGMKFQEREKSSSSCPNVNGDDSKDECWNERSSSSLLENDLVNKIRAGPEANEPDDQVGRSYLPAWNLQLPEEPASAAPCVPLSDSVPTKTVEITEATRSVSISTVIAENPFDFDLPAPSEKRKKKGKYEHAVMRNGWRVYVCSTCDTGHATAQQRHVCCWAIICKLCGKKFGRRSRLNDHMSKEHKEK